MRWRNGATARAAVLSLIACILLPMGARAQSDSSSSSWGSQGTVQEGLVAAFDVVVLRPLGFVKAAVGAAAFVPAALVTAPSGWDSVTTAWEIFVEVPTKDLYQRPLGDF